MLSALCLEAGCEHVTGVDVNMTMVSLASTHLGESSAANHNTRCNSNSKHPDTAQQ